MDEEIAIVDNLTREEKIRKFFLNNKKKIILIICFFVIILFGYFGYGDLKKNKKIKLAEQYNSVIYDFINTKKDVKKSLDNIIYAKDDTYSPLALYFIIDNEINVSNEQVNKYFDILIYETKLDEEIKNLIIFKKALFNSDFQSENNLIKILNPIIKSNSIWKSHALYLMGEYLLSKGQKKKAKEFYNQIISLENSNQNIAIQTQKRLNSEYQN